MDIELILTQMDEMLDGSWSFPLSGGRCVVDAEKMRDLIDDIRIHLPQELNAAQDIVDERAKILETANKEAEAIIRKAEMRARTLVAQEDILKEAQAQANDIQSVAQLQSKEMRQAAYSFSDNALKQTEDAMCHALNDLRATRKALRDNIAQATQKRPTPQDK